MESFEASGLRPIIRVLSVWGFRLDRDPAIEAVVNRWVCGFIIVSGLLNTCLAFPSMFFILFDNGFSAEMTNLGIVAIVITTGYISTIFGYILIVRGAKHFSVLLRSLATAISQIPDDAIRRKTASGLRITFMLFLIPILCSCLPILFSQMKGQLLHKLDDSQPHFYLSLILNRVSFGGNCIWLATSCAFYAITNAMVVIVCKALVNLIDYNLPEEDTVSDVWAQERRKQSSDINRRLVLHQKMSRLVREANRVFSSFLLLSLCEELIAGVVYVKMMTMSNGLFSFSAHNHTIQMFTLVLKAYVCGNVNDKLKSSLVMNQHPNNMDDYDYCSTRQVNYIFYVNEQQMNPAQFTYGGFFAIKKTFIFTVAGTVLTYALVLTGMPDSTNTATPYQSQLSNNASVSV